MDDYRDLVHNTLPTSILAAILEDIAGSDDPYGAAVSMAVNCSRSAKEKSDADLPVSANISRLEAEYALRLAQQYEPS